MADNIKTRKIIKEVLLSSNETASISFSGLLSNQKSKEVTPNNECPSTNTK